MHNYKFLQPEVGFSVIPNILLISGIEILLNLPLIYMATRNGFARDSTDNLILDDVNSTGKEIGRGAYGRVFEVDYQGTLCAAKEIHALLLQYLQDGNVSKIVTDFLNECEIWSTIRHPCVVQFLGSNYCIFVCISLVPYATPTLGWRRPPTLFTVHF